MALDPTVVALIGTVMGGVGLKVAESWLGKNRVKITDAQQIRDELRLELVTLRAENKQLNSDVDKWQREYYDLREKVIQYRTHMVVHGLDPPDEEQKETAPQGPIL